MSYASLLKKTTWCRCTINHTWLTKGVITSWQDSASKWEIIHTTQIAQSYNSLKDDRGIDSRKEFIVTDDWIKILDLILFFYKRIMSKKKDPWLYSTFIRFRKFKCIIFSSKFFLICSLNWHDISLHRNC